LTDTNLLIESTIPNMNGILEVSINNNNSSFSINDTNNNENDAFAASLLCCSIGAGSVQLGVALDVIVVQQDNGGAVATGDFRVKFPSHHVGKSCRIMVNDVPWEGVELIVTKVGGTCKFRKGMSEKPSMEQLATLMELLHNERNELKYELLTAEGAIMGTASAYLFLWKSHYRIVIVDIDGTITKSSARGVWHTVINENFEYVHLGICQFFQQVATENTRVLYLTARNIDMAQATRRLLAGLQQHTFKLPPGPMMGHTGSVYTVLLSELVTQDIYQYKADSLIRQVVLVFGGAGRSATGLLFCAFGNSPTDSMAYEMAGVPLNHIYNISKSSKIHCLDKEFRNGANEEGHAINDLSHHSAPTTRSPRNRDDYKRLFGSAYQGYDDVKLLEDVLAKKSKWGLL